MFRYLQDMRSEKKNKVKNGVGEPDFRFLFTPQEMGGRAELMAVVTLQPGESVGPHSHDTNAEAYVVLEGSACVLEDGVERVLNEGDAEFCGDGHSHAIRNHTPYPVKFLALILPDRK